MRFVARKTLGLDYPFKFKLQIGTAIALATSVLALVDVQSGLKFEKESAL